MNPNRFILTSLSLIVLLQGQLQPVASTRAEAALVIKIASQSPLSGGESPIGIGIRNASELAIKQLGAPLRDQGFDIQFASYDDQSTPDVGVANAKQMVADPAILAVVAHFDSGVAIPSSEVYNANGLAMVSPGTTNPNVTDRGLPTVNRVSGRDDVVGEVDAQFAASLGLTTFYVVNDSTTFGQGVATYFRENALEQGLDVLGFTAITNPKDLSTIVQSIQTASPRAIYLAGNASVMAPLVKQLVAAGYSGKFLGPDGLDSPAYASLSDQAGVGTFYTTTGSPVSALKPNSTFVADYTKAYGTAPPPYAAEAYDSAGLILAAIARAVETANSQIPPTRQAVAAEVRATTDYAGLTGKISFDNVGDRKLANYFIFQVTANTASQWEQNKIVNRFQIPSPAAVAASSP